MGLLTKVIISVFEFPILTVANHIARLKIGSSNIIITSSPSTSSLSTFS